MRHVCSNGFEPKVDKCRGCGRAIIWALNENTRKPIPLDAVAPVYQLNGQVMGEHTPTAGRAVDSYVSHFVTCPKRDQFKKETT